jgi:hypothetical protein
MNDIKLNSTPRSHVLNAEIEAPAGGVTKPGVPKKDDFSVHLFFQHSELPSGDAGVPDLPNPSVPPGNITNGKLFSALERIINPFKGFSQESSGGLPPPVVQAAAGGSGRPNQAVNDNIKLILLLIDIHAKKQEIEAKRNGLFTQFQWNSMQSQVNAIKAQGLDQMWGGITTGVTTLGLTIGGTTLQNLNVGTVTGENGMLIPKPHEIKASNIGRGMVMAQQGIVAMASGGAGAAQQADQAKATSLSAEAEMHKSIADSAKQVGAAADKMLEELQSTLNRVLGEIKATMEAIANKM